VFLQRQALLEPFGMTRYDTEGWGAYERHIDAAQHRVGKEHTQKIESKHIKLRTRIKRLVRRTICFSNNWLRVFRSPGVSRSGHRRR
jgi:insertion element IS1 protein InsB